MISFRQQLWRWLLALLTAVGLLAGASAFWTTLHESEEFLDRQLFEIALNIAATTTASGSLPVPGSTARSDERDALELNDDPENAIAIQVWGPAATPLYTAPAGVDIPRLTRRGHADTVGGGTDWRTYALVLPGRTIQVSQQAVVRHAFAGDAAINALIPIAALIPLSWLLLWLVLRRVTRRLESLVAAIARRDANSDTPISDDDMPTELVPLVGAVNELVDRLQQAIASQKRFVSDAAHQLRTPLAAVKLQLENLRGVIAAPEDTKRLDPLVRGVDRAANLTDQLLKLARYEAGGTPSKVVAIDAAELLRDCIADVLPLADHRHLDIGLDANGADSGNAQTPIWVEGIEEDLRILIGNLLDNAVRYTPENGVVDVRLTRKRAGTDDTVVIEIMDSGPGVEEAAMDHVFDRFYRVVDTGSEGSGLGLSIAARIAGLHGALIDLENRRDQTGAIAGLTARVTFAAAK